MAKVKSRRNLSTAQRKQPKNQHQQESGNQLIQQTETNHICAINNIVSIIHNSRISHYPQKRIIGLYVTKWIKYYIRRC